tara:strand:+ start:7396 stop:7497 length:102 start_codon:yes stop_codon:yes gene_type:complete
VFENAYYFQIVYCDYEMSNADDLPELDGEDLHV